MKAKKMKWRNISEEETEEIWNIWAGAEEEKQKKAGRRPFILYQRRDMRRREKCGEESLQEILWHAMKCEEISSEEEAEKRRK